MKRKVKQYFQRTLAVLLCVMMLFSVADFSVFATELPDGTTQTDGTDTDGTENTDGTGGEDADATGSDSTADETDANVGIATVSTDQTTTEQPLAVVYAASDFQAYKDLDTDEDDIDAGKATMNAIIDTMQNAGYSTVDGALFCGDYSKVYNTWGNEAVTYNNNGLKAVRDVLNEQWGLADDALDGANPDEIVFVQGNHDPANTTGLDSSGANDTEQYGVFVIHEDDFQWKQGDDTSDSVSNSGNASGTLAKVKETANALESYLAEKLEQKYEYPIFVTSHVPLHYSYRTYGSSNQDNIYAKYIFDVLNEYGEKLNIIFLFGHDHSSTYDDYIGGGAVYLPVGDEILIPTSQTAFEEKTLTFTYMNAGYLGYYKGACETDLSSTIFKIYKDKVVVARYDEEGIANLGDAGVWATSDAEWLDDYDYDAVTETSSNQEIKLKEFDVSLNLGSLASGRMTVETTKDISVAGVYDTTYSVTWSSNNEAVATVSASETDSMTATVTGVSVGEATITVTVTELDKTRTAGEVATLEYTIQVTEDTASAETVLLEKGEYTHFVKVDDFEYGKTYMIVDMENGGSEIGPQMTLQYSADVDTDKEGDAADGNNEVNAMGVFTYQLPIGDDTETLILNDKNGLSDNGKWKFVYNSTYGRTFIQTYKSRTKSILSVSEGDTGTYDYYTTDKDQDRLRVIASGLDAAGNTWEWDKDRGLITKRKADGFKYTLRYSQAQTDFIGNRVDHNGTLLNEAEDSRVYLFEQQTISLDNDITAHVDDVTGYINRRDNYATDRMATAQTGDNIVITNGSNSITIPVTTGMLYTSYEGIDTDNTKNNVLVNTNVAGTYTGLTVVYGGQVVTTNYTLEVREAVVLLENDAERERMDNIYTLVDTMLPGRQYLIVDSNEAGIAHAAGTEDPTGNPDYLTAHNVLIQSIPVDGKDGLYIDATRYSSVADSTTAGLVNRGIVDQGNIFDVEVVTATSDDYKKAYDLVWTPTQRAFYYGEYSSGTEFYDTVDNSHYFLVHEVHNQYLSADATNGDAYNSRLEIMGLTNTLKNGTSRMNWKYTAEYELGQAVGLSLNSGRDLFYNFQNQHSSETTAADKNFQTADRDTLLQASTRRVWIYERVTNIDYITATINDLTGKVTAGRSTSALTGDYIIVDTVHADGTVTSEQVNVTTGMLSGGNLDLNAEGTYTNLTVTYQGKAITTNYTLIVEKASLVDNPEFPNEGAVKIDKQLDTTRYNYLETGAATIDLSVTGIPSQSGVDMVVLIDASSSMERCVHSCKQGQTCTVTNKTVGAEGGCPIRMVAMENTLQNMIEQMQVPINGYTADIDIAVATFNGYTPINADYELNYSASGITHDQAQQMSEERFDDSEILLPFTNISQISADVLNSTQGDTTESTDIQYSKGTNYDRAMELAYDLLKAKQDANELNNETRQSVVVFMSDGAPYQYNYFFGDPNVKAWDEYITGKLDDNVAGDQCDTTTGPDETLSAAEVKAHIPTNEEVKAIYDKYYNTDGKHWMAEAIKGNTNQLYKIIDPDAVDKEDQIDYVPGLNAKLYSIGFGLGRDYNVSAEDCEEVLKKMATSEEYYYQATSNEKLDEAFSAIADTVRSAGDAVFTDQMGAQFNLISSNSYTWVDEDGATQTLTFDPAPQIQVKKYELYKRSELGKTLEFTVDGKTEKVTVTEALVGTRKPVEPTVIETITFNADGTEAYSNLKGEKVNILDSNGVICAETFWYNTDLSNAHTITVAEGKTVDLATETFYWNIGDIPQDELVLSYNVYLTGSMEGNRIQGTYDTNTHAELNYKNYYGKECELTVPSPKLPWKQGTVGYAFYLVDGNGNPIINQSTGETGSFEQSVKITQPIYRDFTLNSTGEDVIAEQIVASNVLPEGYTLFDTSAQYDVKLDSNGEGSYKLVKGDVVPTTYVQGIKDAAYKETDNEKFGVEIVTDNYTTANTIVWFAVRSTVACVPDTVVIDYGLPVNINVAANDTMMGNYGAVKYVGSTSVFDDGYASAKETDADLKLWEYLQTVEKTTKSAFETDTLTGTYGISTVLEDADGNATGKVKYTPTTMEMDGKETFVYATEYTGSVGTQGYYYSTVTVIPATTIYYEDNFVDYKVYNRSDFALNTDSSKQWVDVNAAGEVITPNTTATQEEDRPGSFSLSGLDANNIYGSDAAYENMANFSLGSAKKLSVSKAGGVFGEAKFDFYGTGFDIVSLTSNNTGTITVDIYDKAEFATKEYSAKILETLIVDTYYGYVYDKTTDEWKTVTNDPNALYQVPIIKASGLTYGNYTAIVTVDYGSVFDHQNDGTYDFYLDAIRIYDPANDGVSDTEILDAYLADKEGWPTYFEVRNQIINANKFTELDEEITEGIVFIDGNSALTDTNTTMKNPITGKANAISDYANFGPNNELYLAPGQAISFKMDATGDVAAVHLALKSVGGTAKVKVWDANETSASKVTTQSIATATDMYYDITDLNGKTVVIYNAGTSEDAILSVTNVKVTYTSDPYTTQPATLSFRMSRSIASTAIASMSVEETEETTPAIPDDNEDTTTPPENVSGNGTTNSGNTSSSNGNTAGNTSGNTNTGSGNNQGTTGSAGGSNNEADATAPDTEVDVDKDQNDTTVDNNNNTDSGTVDKEEVSESMTFLEMLWEMIVTFFQGLFKMFA